MKPQGIVLFEVPGPSQTQAGNGEDVFTPTESLGAPEHETEASAYSQLRKPSGHRQSVTGFVSPNRFLRHPERPDTAYPDGEQRRCAVLRQLTTQILLAAMLGVLLGALLSSVEASPAVSALVNLPGDIFLQVLKCFVIPMIFTSLTTGVADMVHIGKVSVIGTKMAMYFVGLSLLGAILSTSVSMALRGLNDSLARSSVEVDTAFFEVACANGKFWAANATTGAVSCSADNATASAGPVTLQMVDLTGVLLGDATASAATGVTEQITGILHELLPSNIFASFRDGTLLSVITFSIVFGAAAIKVSSREHSPLLAVLTQMNQVFFVVIRKLIDWSPLAVLSLVAGSLSSQALLGEAITRVGIMMLGYFLSLALFELLFLPALMWLTLRKSPLPYMRAMIPAALFASGCASSIATLPVTLRCVEQTREVPRGLLHFVVTLGCSAHKNGSAMYYPAAMVFLVSTAEQELSLGWWQLALIVFVSLLGSIGTAPITNSSLVVVYSLWQSVYPSVPMPASFSYLVAVDWLFDRFSTPSNVLGDTYVARILAEQVDEAYDAANRHQHYAQS